MEIAKLYRQGGSTVLAIPKRYLKTLGWKPGDQVKVILVGDDSILIKNSATPNPKQSQHFTII